MLKLGLVLIPTQRRGLKDTELATTLTSNRSWKKVVPLFPPRKQANIFQPIKEIRSLEKNTENCLHSVTLYISQRDI